MAIYRVRLLPYARRELDGLPEPTRTRLERAIRALGLEPRPAGARLLAATKRPTWRIRIGDYRVLYEIQADQLIVLVVGAGHRRDVYRHRRISEIATTRYATYRRELQARDAAAGLTDPDPAAITLEVSGEPKKEKQAKVATAAHQWIPAVNNWGGPAVGPFSKSRTPGMRRA